MKIFVIILTLCYFSSILNFSVKGEESIDLTMDIICPTTVYVGDPFVFNVKISNNNTEISHNYTLTWEIDDNDYSQYTVTGEINPNETITLTSSYISFSRPAFHAILFNLSQNGEPASIEIVLIEAIEIEISCALKYKFFSNPIYPNSSFTLNLEIVNEGTEPIFDVYLQVLPIKEARDKIQPYSVTSFRPGNISRGSSSNCNFTFTVSGDTLPGIYSLPIYLEFYDDRWIRHDAHYYIPIEIFSSETIDKLTILEPKIESDLQKLRNELATLQRNMIIITIVLTTIITVCAVFNYLSVRKLTKARRAILPKN